MEMIQKSGYEIFIDEIIRVVHSDFYIWQEKFSDTQRHFEFIKQSEARIGDFKNSKIRTDNYFYLILFSILTYTWIESIENIFKLLGEKEFIENIKKFINENIDWKKYIQLENMDSGKKDIQLENMDSGKKNITTFKLIKEIRNLCTHQRLTHNNRLFKDFQYSFPITQKSLASSLLPKEEQPLIDYDFVLVDWNNLYKKYQENSSLKYLFLNSEIYELVKEKILLWFDKNKKMLHEKLYFFICNKTKNFECISEENYEKFIKKCMEIDEKNKCYSKPLDEYYFDNDKFKCFLRKVFIFFNKEWKSIMKEIIFYFEKSEFLAFKYNNKNLIFGLKQFILKDNYKKLENSMKETLKITEPSYTVNDFLSEKGGPVQGSAIDIDPTFVSCATSFWEKEISKFKNKNYYEKLKKIDLPFYFKWDFLSLLKDDENDLKKLKLNLEKIKKNHDLICKLNNKEIYYYKIDFNS